MYVCIVYYYVVLLLLCVCLCVCCCCCLCVVCVLLCVSLSLLASCLAVPSASLPVPLLVYALLFECLARCSYYYYYYYLLIMLCADSVLCAACGLAVCAYSKPLCCLDDPTPQTPSLFAICAAFATHANLLSVGA